MTFDELPLYEAIHDVYRMVENPRSSDWLIGEQEKLARMVQQHLPMEYPCNRQDILKAWDNFGKSCKAEGSERKKLELAVLVARRFGRRCFYTGRGLGECTAQVNVDRLVPGSRGGEYTIKNCIIACSFHNGQRNDKAIEDYLRTAP